MFSVVCVNLSGAEGTFSSSPAWRGGGGRYSGQVTLSPIQLGVVWHGKDGGGGGGGVVGITSQC